jgi:hypothetical protein
VVFFVDSLVESIIKHQKEKGYHSIPVVVELAKILKMAQKYMAHNLLEGKRKAVTIF